MAETTVVASNGEKVGIGKKSFTFFSDVAREMRKVSWPTRDALQDATIITLVLCIMMSLFTFGVDKIFETVIRGLYRIL